MERPLFWHQGLFLQPQHLQLADLHAQSLLTPVYKYLCPYPWGIGELEIQTAALDNLNFNLVRGNFVFPDMTYTALPGNAIIEARSFDEAWVEGGKPLGVYVGLKKWNEIGENVTVLPRLSNLADVNTRFVTTADPEEVQDLHHNGPPAQVQRLHHVLKVFWETEKDQLGEYQLIPVARLERTGERVVLSEKFIPPALTVKSSEVLLRLIVDIKDQIASRGRQLESYKRDRGIHTAEFGARDTVYLLALRSLNRYIPFLEHVLASGHAHPWNVYGLLRQMIGELSAFSEQVDVMGELADGSQGVLGYDHRNLHGCFEGVGAIITKLLDEITAGPEYVFQLLFDGTYYASDLQPAIFEGANRFYLVFETEADPQSVLQSLETIVKLSSRESLPLLIARALPGIKVEHLSAPPQELPRRARAIYCQIDHHGDQWAQVQKGHNIALYWDTAPEDLKIELMVVGRT
ncbi:MAG TPA: type VI secretion system baseplate subunit TssK [Desulfatiglandales bacterium]|nr:type VI secretion system baseplate subunit TssK [Desulfatiglandales bacterium]